MYPRFVQIKAYSVLLPDVDAVVVKGEQLGFVNAVLIDVDEVPDELAPDVEELDDDDEEEAALPL